MSHIPQIIVVSSYPDSEEKLFNICGIRGKTPLSVLVIRPDPHRIKIEGVRELRQSLLTSGTSSRIIIFSGFDTATPEAQNAMLKLLEETGTSHGFYLVVTQLSRVIPTVRSRCAIRDLRETQGLINSRKSVSTSPIALTKRELLLSIDTVVSSREDGVKFFDEILSRASEDLRAHPATTPESLRHALRLRHLLLENNVNPQVAVDAWILSRTRFSE